MTPKAFFLADNIGLDFLNTMAAPRGEVIEFIPDGNALLAWLVDAGLIDDDERNLLLLRFGIEQMDLIAMRGRALREVVRTTLIAVKSGVQTPGTMGPLVKELNTLFALDPRYVSIEVIEGKTQLRHGRTWEKPEQVLAVIAEDIAMIFGRPDFELVRKCVNPTCMLWFEDKTKAHRRQYCSTGACGNRAKVAAFRLRKKAEASVGLSENQTADDTIFAVRTPTS